MTQRLQKNISLFDEVDDGETIYTCCEIIFSGYASNYKQGLTISNLNLNSA